MTPTAKALLLFLVATLLIFAWMFRFDVRPDGKVGAVFVTDRWLGTVQGCVVPSLSSAILGGTGCVPIYPPKPNSK